MRVPFTFGDVLRVLVICLIVGFIVRALGFGPVDFWLRIGDMLEWASENARAMAGSALEWIAIGAAIVLPILALRYAWRSLRRR